MNRNILSLVLLVSFAVCGWSQVVLDNEAPESSITFQYFGSSIDGATTEIIDNPNASGLNASAKVVEFIKPAGSEVWAGGFANPAPIAAVDATNGGQVCIKVHLDHIGNLALKLENPSEGEDWILTQENTVTNEWEELCFDLSANSIEDSNLPATGRTFGQMVLFFDFGTSFDADQTYFFDDITYQGIEGGGNTGGGDGTSNVTFSVDMNGFEDAFTQVFVSGSLNGWDGLSNPLSDEDGDGIWTGVIPLENGIYEFKYTLDNWTVQEEFEAGAECTLTTDVFTNRIIEVLEDTEVCFAWNTCTACDGSTGGGNTGGGNTGGAGGNSNVTFSVDMNDFSDAFTQAFVSGSLNGWDGQVNPLSDEDGDGIWTGTISLENGTYEFKYTLDNWTFQEEFEPGSDCTLTTDVFTNRIIEVVGDTEFCFVWNTCSSCGEGGDNTGGGETGGNTGGGMNTGTCSTIYDFETDATSTDFQYFGSSLDGSTAAIVNNPNPSGINTSSQVSEYIKAANSEVWAGAFANPAPVTPIDVTNGGQICVKVHLDHIGNLAIKLEQSTTGGEDWITTISNTKVNEWEELCFDLNAPSIEGSGAPAVGHVYAQMVIFFDFGSNSDMDVIYYLDDINFCGSNIETPDQDITFTVDMNNYEGDFTQVYVSGDFNAWSGDANPLSDEDGDGVWTSTLTLPTGPYEYKFTLDNWTVQEEFSGSETCTNLTLGDNDERFVNRVLTVTPDGISPAAVCFNSCFGCGEAATITINLNMSAVGAAESGVFIAGGAEFGPSNEKFQLMDPDGDGIFSITIERPLGWNSYYTFTNGNCPDFSCKENIAGQACARPENFNDRFIDNLTGDLVINTCFAECTTTTEECQGAAVNGMITFEVDMNSYEGTIGTVYVSGTMNGWSGDTDPLADEDGDGIWTGIVEVAGGNHEYKFTIDNWLVQEQFEGGEECTVSDPSGQFVNRSITVDGDASLCFVFDSCMACSTVSTNDLLVNDDLFAIQPTLVQESALLEFQLSNNEAKQVRIYSITGNELHSFEVEDWAKQSNLQTSTWEAGIYLVTVRTETMIATKRIVKQ